jgi:hypothetical protein
MEVREPALRCKNLPHFDLRFKRNIPAAANHFFGLIGCSGVSCRAMERSLLKLLEEE